ncbi:uncharacterized mitochondrial protein AtMg00860-like [Primulina eburnea]|uniref:uncharacterized mitochondrial protein AtMg00860-like n=1 Tax=Primulina eburnea TaxID=1245227 RepID=UPI003C6C5E58
MRPASYDEAIACAFQAEHALWIIYVEMQQKRHQAQTSSQPQKRVAFVCHIVSRDGIEVDPSKVESVRDWPVPKSVTKIRSFLGLDGYYKNFIQRFSFIAVPLIALTKKNVQFFWGSECQESFDRLKQASTTVPVLAMP